MISFEGIKVFNTAPFSDHFRIEFLTIPKEEWKEIVGIFKDFFNDEKKTLSMIGVSFERTSDIKVVYNEGSNDEASASSETIFIANKNDENISLGHLFTRREYDPGIYIQIETEDGHIYETVNPISLDEENPTIEPLVEIWQDDDEDDYDEGE